MIIIPKAKLKAYMAWYKDKTITVGYNCGKTV